MSAASTIDVDDARAALLQLIDRALAGEEIVIARDGQPLVRLVPVEGRPPREPGALKGLFELPDGAFEPLPPEVVDAFEGETGPSKG